MISLLLGSCSKECDLVLNIPTSVNTAVAIANEAEIQAYITDNNISTQKSSTGLHYTIEEAGSFENPELCSLVTVEYSGYLTNGVSFDSSGPNGATFPLSDVILGWQEGISLFGKGGKGKLIIPSKLAYGPNPPSSKIPANGVLIFDIHLIDFSH